MGKPKHIAARAQTTGRLIDESGNKSATSGVTNDYFHYQLIS